MPGEDGFQAERAELDALLSSGVFARSPSIAQMLRYVCEMHFRGQAHEIKEYNIAIEAFGRPADFDQTRDSIVRVEAHRLRKRLQDYYQGAGADHEFQIAIPSGSYAPHFIRGADTRTAQPDPIQELPATAAPSSKPAGGTVRAEWNTWRLWGQYALGALAMAFLMSSFFWARSVHDTATTSSLGGKVSSVAEAALSPGDEVRILAGAANTKLVDHYGNTWLGDRYFQGGTTLSVPPRPIFYSQDPAIFYHFRQGDFTYDIPLKKGCYELRLYFAETVFGENNVAGGGETTRVFRMKYNGKELLPYLDVVADAGGSDTADIKVFRDIQPAEDGMLHLAFQRLNNEAPFVNAIEILPSRPGAIRPIRILARDSSFVDQSNRLWSADRYFHNGVLVQRHEPVAGTDEESLYQNERFGNFTYAIPVARNGRYAVTFRFCEAWFGEGRPAGGGVGERLFDLYFNGRILLENFDVFKEAGSLRALDKSFKGLESNAQGKLIFTFTPRLNYAMVDAIEVLDEAWK